MVVPISFFRYIGGVVTPILVDRTRPLEVFMQVVDILGRYSSEYLVARKYHREGIPQAHSSPSSRIQQYSRSSFYLY